MGLVNSIGSACTRAHTRTLEEKQPSQKQSRDTEKGQSVCSGGHLKECVQLMVKYVLVCVCGRQCVRLRVFRPVWFCFPPPSLPALICENLKSALNKNSSINSITHNSFCSSFVRQTAGLAVMLFFLFLRAQRGAPQSSALNQAQPPYKDAGLVLMHSFTALHV